MYNPLKALGYIATMLVGNSTFQRKYFNICFRSDNQMNTGKWLLRAACRVGKQKMFINHLKQNNKLNNEEKNLLMAYAWRNLGLYNRAWLELKDIEENSQVINALKCDTLYDIRDVKKLIELSDKVNISTLLSEKKKDFIIKYTVKNYGSAEFHKLCEALDDNKEEKLSQFKERYVSYFNEKSDWGYFQKRYRKQFDITDSNDIENCVYWLMNLSDEEMSRGLSLLLYRIKDDPKMFTVATNFISSGGYSIDEIINNDIKYLSLAQYNYNLLRFNKSLEMSIKSFGEGDRSNTLYNLIINNLEQVSLNRSYFNYIRSMVDANFINLCNSDSLYLLNNCSGFHRLYDGEYFFYKTAEEMNSVITSAKNLPKKVYKSLLVQLITPFVYVKRSLPMNINAVKEISHMLSGMHKWDTLQVRWFVQNREISEALNNIAEFEKGKQLKIFLYIAKYCYENKEYQLALQFAENAYKIDPQNVNLLRRLISCHNILGNISKRLFYIKKLKVLASDKLYSQEYNIALDEYSLQKREWNWSRRRKQVSNNGSILHVLNKSLPEINGYTIRSTEIVEHQRIAKLKPVVVTKLGWPLSDTNLRGITKEINNEVEHYRLYDDNNSVVLNKVPLSDYFRIYADQFSRLVRMIQPRIIHAASNFQNALPALKVAQKYGIPSVYEVRGLWHDTQATKVKGFEDSERYLLHQKYELICCHMADKVVVISKSLKEHLVTQGIAEEKITFVPNGVDVKKFIPQKPNRNLKKKLNLEEKFVIGFIGSVTHYEGLNYLLEALVSLKKEMTDIRLIVVGDGKALEELKELTIKLNLEKVVTFVGRVPHNEVKDYYSIIDVFPFPRTNAKVCQLVTPLKPFEAMAMGKMVLVSDIPALREMVIEGKTGLVFQSESVDSLKQCIKQARKEIHLSNNAREWVVRNRDWAKLSETYIKTYKSL